MEEIMQPAAEANSLPKNGERQKETSDGTNFLKKEDYFMKMAMLTAKRSKDSNTQVGCCIVKDGRIISLGYNSLPKGLHDDDIHWKKPEAEQETKSDEESIPKSNEIKDVNMSWMTNKYNFVVYAVANAFVNKLSTDVTGGTLYSTLMPSNECFKIIIQSGIQEIVFLDQNNLSENKKKAAEYMNEKTMYDVKCTDKKETLVKIRAYNGTKLTVKYDNEHQSKGKEKKSGTSTTDDNQGKVKKRTTCDVSLSGERTNYLSWNEYFMGVALLTAEQSKDPAKQVGCCIVNPEKRIVGLGYNAMPKDSDEFPWSKDDSKKKDPDYKENKHYYVLHAELNAMINKIADINGCKLYCTLHPCNKCAQLIIQSGIKKVVYKEDDKEQDEFFAANMMFKKAGIKLKKYKERQQQELQLLVNDECKEKAIDF